MTDKEWSKKWLKLTELTASMSELRHIVENGSTGIWCDSGISKSKDKQKGGNKCLKKKQSQQKSKD